MRPWPQRAALRLRRSGIPGLIVAAVLACSLLHRLQAAALAWTPPSSFEAVREARPRELLDAGQRWGRRGALARVAVEGLAVPGVVAAAAGQPVLAEVSNSVTLPGGLQYEKLEPGTTGTAPRDGPPRNAARIWLKFAGHIENFQGPVFDSSSFRGKRKASKNDYIETTVGLDVSISPGMWQVVKLMKVGEKGRFVLPPDLSYNEGKGFEGDEDGEVKTVPANATLYYDVELVKVIRP